MNAQCPRCLSSSFKLLIAGDGNRKNCCEFCAKMEVRHDTHHDYPSPHHTVTLWQKPEAESHAMRAQN